MVSMVSSRAWPKQEKENKSQVGLEVSKSIVDGSVSFLASEQLSISTNQKEMLLAISSQQI